MKDHVNILKSHQNQPETIKENKKTYENTLKNHEDQPKIVKNHNIKNIINDGQRCVGCAAFSKSHAKHLVNRDYETLLLGDFG